MTRLFNHSIRSEMLVLYVAENWATACLVLALLLAGGSTGLSAPSAIGGTAPVLLAVLAALGAGLVAGAVGLYRPAALRGGFPSLARGVTWAVLLGLLLALLLEVLPVDPGPGGRLALLATIWGGCVVATALTRFILGLLRLPLSRVALVGQPTPDSDALHRDYQPFEVTLSLPPGEALLESLERGRLRAWRVWAVVGTEAALAPLARQRCGAAGLQVFTTAEFSEHGLHRVDIDRLPDDWLESANVMRESRGSAALRRGFDIAIALALLTLTLPLILLTMLAIRLEGPGPILYRQERVGRGNRTFELLKFRSMIPDAEAGGVPVWAARRDSRVTRVGRVLRLCRIDEIPQLLNVLRGDMSMIGPRPERPAFVQQLGEIIPHYHDRAVTRPGITGWAQVNHPYGASVEDARMKLSYDLYYIRRRSLFLDVLILLATVRVVLFQEGAR